MAIDEYKIIHQDDILVTMCYLIGIPIPSNGYGNFIPFLVDEVDSLRELIRIKQHVLNQVNILKHFNQLQNQNNTLELLNVANSNHNI